MPKETPTKRKAISKKMRFEVFKRDSFTCQYCGRKAPDVVLHIDHIKPVAKGGKNDIMNYVTSCVECNLGKGARELSDDSVVEKSRKQAELLQERIEQIDMLRDWHIQLVTERDAAVGAVNSLYARLMPGKEIAEEHKTKIPKLISEFGLAHVLESLQAGTAGYGGDALKALDKLPGICARRAYPEIDRRSKLLTKMGYRFWNFKKFEAVEILNTGYKHCGDAYFDRADSLCRRFDGCSWGDVKEQFINAAEEETQPS